MIHYIIGAGGIGSWLVPKLCKLVNPKSIVIIDADVLERRNLDRQLFNRSEVGSYKADALSKRYKTLYQCDFYHTDLLRHKPEDWIFGCADNHRARREILASCDRDGCRAVIGGNLYTDADAYYYDRSLCDTGADPRVYMPQLLDPDAPGDPLASCQGVAQDERPQLALANDTAALMMMRLYWFHRERGSLPSETKPYWPRFYSANLYRMSTKLIDDITIQKGFDHVPTSRELSHVE